MKYVVPLPAQAFLPVAGSNHRYPVKRVYCVGRNYAAHAIEMGGNPEREEPFFFQKNPDNLVINGSNFPYPDKSNEVHHEIELVVGLGHLPLEGAIDIPLDRANDYVWGYAVGIDMTRRDLQAECKERRRPWEVAKGFDHSAPCGPIHAATETGTLFEGNISLAINGELRQEGNLNQLIWKIPEIINYLSGLFRLHSGDVIMTGTPAGVGPVKVGDELTGSIAGLDDLHCRVV